VPSSWLDDQLAAELDDLNARSRLRQCPPVVALRGTHLDLEDSAQLVSFSSNDYLGLSTHPELVDSAIKAVTLRGIGAGASRLVSGDRPEHREFESQLADFLSVPSSLLFPTGYQANIGAITALAGQNDLIVSDALNHASLIDGCRLSKAHVAIYRHGDASDARKALSLATNSRGQPFRRKLLVTESVFSMDGDVAPLSALDTACKEQGAALIVDEAHAFGALGPGGQGICSLQNVIPALRIGTLGKAFGTAGGFLVGSDTVRNYVLNRARTFIFTTGLPPSIAAASLAALNIIRSSEGDELRGLLSERIKQLHAGIGFKGPMTPICPLILGPDAVALQASAKLRELGVFVQAIRPPTVPEGTSRLRITISARHTSAEVDYLVGCLKSISPSPP